MTTTHSAPTAAANGAAAEGGAATGRAAEALLLAGAILPPGTEVADGVRTDPVRARRYAHPALGDRAVIRLVGDTVAPGEDQTLAFLGFEPPEAGEPIGLTQRHGLGFPQWVLVNDPGHAREALAVVREMERAARLARTKPGAAKDLYDELARRLTRPAHLPSFWEQAGRAFTAAGAVSHAAAIFERAREAERVYALDVDEDARREVFLEFAFAGALSVKSLSGYASELQRRYLPAEAYEAFGHLALRRTLGGLPPWLDLPKQLRRLAAAAGLDQAAEDERLLGRILPLPATRLAPAGFWAPYRAALIRMARASDETRGLLLGLFPEPSAGGREFHGWWLGLLDEAGALDAIIQPAAEGPAPVAPAQGAAGWLGRTIGHLRRGWRDDPLPAEVLALIPRMAERLRADAVPVVVTFGGWRRLVDPDVAEVCLANGIPVADPDPGAHVDLDRWLAGDQATRTDLAHVAAHPRFRPLLAGALAVAAMPQGRALDDLLVSPALEGVGDEWLTERVGAVDVGGLDHARSALAELADTTGKETFARFPAARERLADADLAVPLARTLRGGLPDELGWPALEEAMAELSGPVSWSASWPVLVVASAARAVAVGPGGRVATHDLRVGNLRGGVPQVWFAGGQFLVSWYGDDGQVAYWSGDPGEVFAPGPHATYWYRQPLGFAPLLPDGGRVSGGRALHPGDRSLPGSGEVLWDGTTCWTVLSEGDSTVARELDPGTGALGRRSLPSFLEDGGGHGRDLLLRFCSLAPAPPGMASPLGQRDGMVGFRVTADGSRRPPALLLEGVDGRRHDSHYGGDPRLLDRGGMPDAVAWGALTLPGSPAPLPLSGGDPVTLGAPGLIGPLAGIPIGIPVSSPWRHAGDLPPGTPFGVPPAFWHCLRPRDPAGSQALRGVTEAHARELLDAAAADLAAVGGDQAAELDRLPRTAAAIGRVLPEVTDPLLLRGLLGAARRGAQLLDRHLAMARTPAAPRDPGRGAAARLARGLREGPLLTALDGLADSRGYHDSEFTQTGAQMLALGEFFAGRDAGTGDGDRAAREAAAEGVCLRWPALLGRIGAAAFRAASPVTGDAERATLLDLLDLWAELPFSADPGSFRAGAVTGIEEGAGRSDAGAWVVLASTSRFGWYPGQERERAFIERPARDGAATCLPAPATVTASRAVEPGWGRPEQLRAFTATARRRGPVPWDPAVPAALADRTGLSVAEATLLWAGLPGLTSWEANFLSPEVRALTGLKAADARTARDTLRAVTPEQRLVLLHAAMPEDPAELWSPPGGGPRDDASPAARMAAAWVALFGRRVAIPGDALAEAANLSRRTSAAELLGRLADPEREPALVRDLDWRPVVETHRGWVQVTLTTAGQDDPPALEQALADLAIAIPWAAATRPVGDPLLARLPRALALARARLDHDKLLLPGGHVYRDGDPVELMRSLFGSTPYREAPVDAAETADDGLSVAVATTSGLTMFFRPARLPHGSVQALLAANQAAQRTWPHSIQLVELLRSDGYGAIAERVRSTPVTAGGYEANPLLSVPELVAGAGERLGVDQRAAQLYLQLLTLAEPTDRNVRKWNGWSAATHRQAVATLAGAGLVLEAKRERAGRGAFLPGGWLPARAPNLPLESWKLPLYRLQVEPGGGRPSGPLPRHLPLRPLHELFAEAWARVLAGDVPGGGAGPGTGGAR